MKARRQTSTTSSAYLMRAVMARLAVVTRGCPKGVVEGDDGGGIQYERPASSLFVGWIAARCL